MMLDDHRSGSFKLGMYSLLTACSQNDCCVFPALFVHIVPNEVDTDWSCSPLVSRRISVEAEERGQTDHSSRNNKNRQTDESRPPSSTSEESD